MSFSTRNLSASDGAGAATTPTTGIAPVPFSSTKRAAAPTRLCVMEASRSRRLSKHSLISSSVCESIVRNQLLTSRHSVVPRELKKLFDVDVFVLWEAFEARQARDRNDPVESPLLCVWIKVFSEKRE